MLQTEESQEAGATTPPPRKKRRGRTSEQTIAAAERRVRVLDLRAQGWNFKEIAEELGISVSTAHGDADRAFAEISPPTGQR